MVRGRRRLSILILTLNEETNLPGLMESFDAVRAEVDQCDVELELVIVDAGSTDGTVALAAQLGFDRILEVPGTSIPEARNAAAVATDSPWLGYIDADCRVTAGWVTSAVTALEAEELVVAGWPTTGPSEPTWVQRGWQAHGDSKLEALEYESDGSLSSEIAYRLITARNMVCTREAFNALEGFDERLPTGEDAEFAFRAWVGDFGLVGAPGMQVVHLGEPATLSEFYRQQLWHANHQAYGAVEADGRQVRNGRNPQLFSLGFLVGAVLLAVGVLAAWRRRRAEWLMAAAVPLSMVVGLPSAMTAWRRRDLRLVAPLAVLYAAYGAARSVDLLGGANRIRSWRSDA